MSERNGSSGAMCARGSISKGGELSEKTSFDVAPGYEPLAEVLQLALDQSQNGKGRDRHANDKPILQQPIMEIGRMVGPGYNIGQAMKKGQEAMRLPPVRAQAELLGAINYLAAAYLLVGETVPQEVEDQPTAPMMAGYPDGLDDRLPSITLPGNRDACAAKYAEELAEWRAAPNLSDEACIETWDRLQAAYTWYDRGGHAVRECVAAIESARGNLADAPWDIGQVERCKRAMLVKNAARQYYAPEVCAVILASDGERYDP